MGEKHVLQVNVTSTLGLVDLQNAKALALLPLCHLIKMHTKF